MAKVLLVDTNFSSSPIYKELLSLGHEVHVVGSKANDFLAKAVRNYWCFDYADIDKLSALINKEKFDFIVPGCTDQSYTSCSAINMGQYPGLESIEVDRQLNNKANFRALAKRLSLSIPILQDLSSEMPKWPIIVKPVDAFSGNGITVLQESEIEYLETAIIQAKKYSKNGEYLIEEFVAGDLYSHSAFISSGKIISDFIVQENCTVNKFVVDTSRVIFEPSKTVQMELRDSIEKIAKELNLNDGLIHMQYICNNDQIWLIEVTRRCPGDLYSQLIEMSTGYPYTLNYIRPFLGLKCTVPNESSIRKFIMRHTMTVPAEQCMSYIKYNRRLMIERWVSLSLAGDVLKSSPFSRIGILFSSAQSEVEMDDIYAVTLQRDLYEVVKI